MLQQTGDQVIEALGLKSRTFEASMKHLAMISVGNLVLSWLGLLWEQRQRRRLHGHNRQKSLRMNCSTQEENNGRVSKSLHPSTSVQVPIVKKL